MSWNDTDINEDSRPVSRPRGGRGARPGRGGRSYTQRRREQFGVDEKEGDDPPTRSWHDEAKSWRGGEEDKRFNWADEVNKEDARREGPTSGDTRRGGRPGEKHRPRVGGGRDPPDDSSDEDFSPPHRRLHASSDSGRDPSPEDPPSTHSDERSRRSQWSETDGGRKGDASRRKTDGKPDTTSPTTSISGWYPSDRREPRGRGSSGWTDTEDRGRSGWGDTPSSSNEYNNRPEKNKQWNDLTYREEDADSTRNRRQTTNETSGSNANRWVHDGFEELERDEQRSYRERGGRGRGQYKGIRGRGGRGRGPYDVEGQSDRYRSKRRDGGPNNTGDRITAGGMHDRRENFDEDEQNVRSRDKKVVEEEKPKRERKPQTRPNQPIYVPPGRRNKEKNPEVTEVENPELLQKTVDVTEGVTGAGNEPNDKEYEEGGDGAQEDNDPNDKEYGEGDSGAEEYGDGEDGEYWEEGDPVVLEIVIEVEPNKQLIINARKNDNPKILAEKFCQENNMKEELVGTVEDLIKQHLEAVEKQ